MSINYNYIIWTAIQKRQLRLMVNLPVLRKKFVWDIPW